MTTPKPFSPPPASPPALPVVDQASIIQISPLPPYPNSPAPPLAISELACTSSSPSHRRPVSTSPDLPSLAISEFSHLYPHPWTPTTAYYPPQIATPTTTANTPAPTQLPTPPTSTINPITQPILHPLNAKFATNPTTPAPLGPTAIIPLHHPKSPNPPTYPTHRPPTTHPSSHRASDD